MFEKIFEPKPKQEVPRPHTQEEREAESRRRSEEIRARARQEDEQDMEEARRKFELEKPNLQKRLEEIPREIAEIEQSLTEMQGQEMRKILDRGHQLNSSLSPISSTDPSRQREYDMWAQALGESKRATAQMKQDLEARIQKKKAEADKLKQEEMATIQQRMERGY